MIGEGTRVLDAVERLTAGRPPVCPWRSAEEPLVREVTELYRACGGITEQGPVPARVLALDPPHKIWQGLLHYVAAVSLVRSADVRKARERREKTDRLNRPWGS